MKGAYAYRRVNLVKFERVEGIGPSKEAPSSFLQLETHFTHGKRKKKRVCINN